MVEVRLDGNKELRRLVRDFGKIPPDLRKELRPALVRAAKPILAAARANASWSSRIPRATRIKVGFTARKGGVSIVVNSKRAPHARPYENLGDPGTFRHPVYGNREVWVTQVARPFLIDAVQEKGGIVTRTLGLLVIQIGRKHGWKG
ncbi:hypothetical protein HNP84_000229 [Thermocatellispora tengchongensis]|uniref:HK97 gp10 family phage protein n=1 Tax=Thermocatellispora tengchongensis TaxID=1073253 RepID=A0A840NY06_9ACTN|nr:HK97 gp10 family phage protein [Thermocatellispora tengchongensis]MBB5130541.1 hypothetical protein [Thermocatellispora tengchongensis]